MKAMPSLCSHSLTIRKERCLICARNTSNSGSVKSQRGVPAVVLFGSRS